jgi:uncharacterized protein YcbK (DUF882 family)
MNRKPRADSKLKTLPEERQAAIIEFMSSHKLTETVKSLREDGLDTSVAALSDFYSWRQLRQQFAEDETTTESLLEQLKREVPNVSDEQLDEIGQRTFSLLSLRRQDLSGFMKVRTARTKGLIEAEKLKLARIAEERHGKEFAFEKEKWVQESCNKILAAATDARTREIAEMAVPNGEKIRLLRQHWFADVDELEKSGDVKLPQLTGKKPREQGQ